MPEWRFEAIGTAWQVDSPEPIESAARERVAAGIAAFDHIWSRFRTDGLIAELSTGRPVDLGPDAVELLDLYDRAWQATDGAVNPCVGASLERLGYDADYSLRPAGPALVPPRWSDCNRSGSVLQVPAGTVLDVGAAGKGLLVDRVAAWLEQPAVVDAGGDLLNTTDQTIRVALEHPADPTRAIGVVNLAPGTALCGSAVNRRAWGEGLHHVLDARTGEPTAEVLATWALASTAAQADLLATALFFEPAERLVETFHFSSVRVTRGGTVDTHLLNGEVFR